MKQSILSQYAPGQPRALVFDDHKAFLNQMQRRLTRDGFEVTGVRTKKEFFETWKPGLFDVIVADWELSHHDRGDQILHAVRARDWEVPFVLISGQLAETTERLPVVQRLLDEGRARFVERGDSGIQRASEEAQRLLARRDVVIVGMIAQLRKATDQDAFLVTSSGKKPVVDILAELLAELERSEFFEHPLAAAFLKWKGGKN